MISVKYRGTVEEIVKERVARVSAFDESLAPLHF